jgi:hypothetical protein
MYFNLAGAPTSRAAILRIVHHFFVDVRQDFVTFVRHYMVPANPVPIWIPLFHSLLPSTFTHTPCAITELGGKFAPM